jgi:hypothetical protein
MTTTYELAKLMKAKGVPQHPYCEGITCWPNACRISLSELVEGCGDRFECLYRIVNKDLSLKHWQVHGFGIEKLPTGSSPEEAVFNLWQQIEPHERINFTKNKTV